MTPPRARDIPHILTVGAIRLHLMLRPQADVVLMPIADLETLIERFTNSRAARLLIVPRCQSGGAGR